MRRNRPGLRFLRNDLAANADWLAIKLSGNGETTNRDAVGARVQLYLKNQQVPLIRSVYAAAAQLALPIWEQSNKPAAAATRSRLTLYTDKQ